MAFIGNTNTTQAFTPAIDYFSGNASTTAFTLSKPVASVAQVQVVVNNVAQNPSSAYTVSGNTITFTSAPSAGTNNIYVYYTSPITQVIAPSQGTVGVGSLSATGTPSASTFLRGDNSWQVVSVNAAAVSDQNNAATGYFDLPTGTTAQRPGTPAAGMIRYNTTESKYEIYSGTQWLYLSGTAYPYSISYLIVAGGGGGGGQIAGGGGAGGLLYSASAGLTPGVTYTVTVGAGGAGGSGSTDGALGSNSIFGAFTATGGGAGQGGESTHNAQQNGGSGGGQGRTGGGRGGTVGTGTSGQGNNGGSGVASGGTDGLGSGGGGGGAGAVGGNAVGAGSVAGSGGAGLSYSITGSATFYAGGGGGGAYNGTLGTGGSGVGGNGGAGGTGATSGAAFTGSGGGGAGYPTNASGSGGSGVVILSIPTANYSGVTTGSPTVTTSGSNTILRFTGSGSYSA